MANKVSAIKFTDSQDEVALEVYPCELDSKTEDSKMVPGLRLRLPLGYYDQDHVVNRYLDQEQAQDLAQYILDWLRSLNGNTNIPRDGD